MKIYSANKGQLPAIITLLVVVFLGACYFFIYVPANEKIVQGQRFRSLQNIDRNIHTKIDNSLAMLDQLIPAYHGEPGNKDTITRYIVNYSKDNFTLTLPVKLYEEAIAKKDSIDFYNIRVNNATGNISLLDQKAIVLPADTVVYQMTMQFKMEQFIKRLLPASVFDEYIIFSDGRPLYETFPSGISTVKNDSLLTIKAGVTGSVVQNYKISGLDYKMFLQPVNVGNNEWIVAGLLTEKRYSQEKNQLPAGVVLFLVTIVLAIILLFPWIKLYQMGSQDRLTLADAISTVVIAMLLVSLIFFMFFKYNVPFRTNYDKDEKAILATTIKQNFKEEINAAYEKVKAFDSLNNYVENDVIRLGKWDKPGISYKNDKRVEIDTAINNITKGWNIKQVFWLDANGEEIRNWNEDAVNGPHSNYKDRAYFDVIKNGRAYLLNDSLKYFIDQVVSRTTGSFTTVMSMPSKYGHDSAHVVCMSFSVKSLQRAVLPTGFQFAMIDQSGKVLYHSDSSKSLNENLLNELSESDQLKSCMEARTSAVFSTGYFSNDYYVHASPLSGLPYFIILFEDKGFKETRDMEVYSFTFTYMLFFFGFMLVQMVVTFIVSSRQSFFKKQLFNTSWIGPRSNLHRQYNMSVMMNLSVILLVLLFFYWSSFLLFGFLLLFSVTFLSLFQNIILAKYYKKKGRIANYTFKINTIRWLIFFIILIDLFALITINARHLAMLMLFEITCSAIGMLIHRYGASMINSMRRRKPLFFKRYKYVHSFTLMACTRLIVTSGIPVMFFYITAYNYEQNIDIRYKQLQFARNVVDKVPGDSLAGIQYGLPYKYGVYFDSSWVKYAYVVNGDSLARSIRNYSNEEKRSILLLNLVRLHLTAKSVNDDKFFSAVAKDFTFYHNDLFGEACTDCGTVTAVQTRQPDTYLQVVSADLDYHFPGILCKEAYCKGILYWLLFFASLALFYFILLNIIRKIFVLAIPDFTRWETMDEEILTNLNLNNLVFVLGLPGAGKLSRILDKINNQQIRNKAGESYHYDPKNDGLSDVFIADMMNIPDTGSESANDAAWKFYERKIFQSKNKLVIINHFEYNIQDAYTTRVKLNLLENIMLQYRARVIILSTIHPVAFLDSVMEQARLAGVPGQDLARWHVLLGHFRIVVFPLQEKLMDEKTAGLELTLEIAKEKSRVPLRYRIQDSARYVIAILRNGYSPGTEEDKLALRELEQEIAYETSRTHFLNKMHGIASYTAAIMKDQYSPGRAADELAFKLQMTAHYFYMYIWQSLTKEEKFLLYDHAEDNLVNSYDDYNLNMLISKGVLVRSDGALRIFNNGFRNFVLTAIGNTEAMKIKEQIKDNGNWNKLKAPMVIIILAIMVFLIASQQEAYTKLITYAAALATGIPVIMRIFSLFDGTKDKIT